MLNLDKFEVETDGKYGIPANKGTKKIPNVEFWVNYREKIANPATVGCHFFLDDYRFTNLWNQPDRYVDIIRQFGAVLSPDFSTYTDMPRALQIFNHYRKQWCAAYWEKLGITVIPTISWGDRESFDFCFDGVPSDSVVAVSSVGCIKNAEARKNFEYGFEAMLERLNPCSVLYYGKKYTESPLIVEMGTPFYNKFTKKERKKDGR